MYFLSQDQQLGGSSQVLVIAKSSVGKKAVGKKFVLPPAGHISLKETPLGLFEKVNCPEN